MYIDIRSKSKYDYSHIDNAINIGFYELYFFYDNYLNKTTKYYIYCDNGNRSRILVNRLNKKGFNCVNIDGGFNNYLKKRYNI